MSFNPTQRAGTSRSTADFSPNSGDVLKLTSDETMNPTPSNPPLADRAKVERDVPGALSVPREFPLRLAHRTPGWVKSGAIFHIRIRCARSNTALLTASPFSTEVLHAVRHYHDSGRWFAHLFLLMPDHAHALICFPPDTAMSTTIGAWKSFLARTHGIRWQSNYFDHRIRHDKEFAEKWDYIRRNPVVKTLCADEDDWPWQWQP